MLSERERDVLRLVARGMTNEKIGEELGLVLDTIKTHLQRIFAKVEVRDRAFLVTWGYRQGILQRLPEQGIRPEAAYLTNREKEMIHWVIRGYTNQQIAKRIFLSEQTVKTHLRRTFKKTGARNRAHLVTLAWQYNLVPHEAWEEENSW